MKITTAGTLEIGNGVSIRPEEFCHLSNYIGQDIITSSGDTLLGADDKAGIAEIMELCEILLCDKSIEHGEIGVAFTPDEEIGHGAALLDIEGFAANTPIPLTAARSASWNTRISTPRRRKSG